MEPLHAHPGKRSACGEDNRFACIKRRRGRRNRNAWLAHGQPSLRCHRAQLLNHTAGPLDTHDFDVRRSAETEVRIRSILTAITAATRYLAHLPAALRCCLEPHFRANAGTVR